MVVASGHSEKRLYIHVTYSTNLLTDTQGVALVERLSSVLRTIVERPNEPLRELDSMPAEEKETIWSRNHQIPLSIDRCIHDLFADQVKARPDAPAVEAWDGALTYKELDEMATLLALRLVSLGVKEGDIVPLLFERTMWTTVAVVAVLKAGGCFVVLEPSHPESRLALIVKQSAASLVLSSEVHCELASRLGQRGFIVGPHLAMERSNGTLITSQLPKPSPSSPCYVVFTSGSTGTPKGVIVPHGALCTNIYYQADILGFHRDSRVLNFAANPFDLFVYETTMALANGGCLCVPSDSDRKDNLTAYIRAKQPSVAITTPSVTSLLEPAQVPSLKYLSVGGESVYESEARRWWDTTHFRNVYGPSECTPLTVINDDAVDPAAAARIGRGVGAVTWIADAKNHDKLVPIGVVGELLLEGPLVGNGYLADPERTQSTFIQDPAWLLRGSEKHQGRHGRLYKTGDLVRYHDDGSLIYVARKDTQVKIRGQRVELGEVERVIRECVPEAREAEQLAAEVIVPKGERSSPALAVFFSVEDTPKDSPPRVIQIPSHVEDGIALKLPIYMVPSVYFAMPKLPMTVTGKTDRKSLRELAATFTAQQLADWSSFGEKQMPSTAVELKLQLLWASLLKLDKSRIGVEDSFFRLGGDSVSAMKLVGQARQQSISLSVSDIFRHPRLSALARIAEGRLAEKMEKMEKMEAFSLLDSKLDPWAVRERIATSINVQPEQIEDVYPSTPLQQGLIALASKRPGAYTMQSILRLSERMDVDRFCLAWDRAVELTPILRTRIVEHEALGLVQTVVKEPVRWIEGDDLETYLKHDRKTLSGPGQPLARYGLIRAGEKEASYFVWTLHHAIYDGGSVPLMLNLVHQLYDDFAPPPSADIRLFVKYLEQRSRADVEAYWQGQFSQATAITYPTLPPSVLDPAPDATAEQFIAVPSSFKKSEFTLTTLIRAAWALVSSSRTGNSCTAFGAVVSGRQSPIVGVESMMMPTIATVPVQITVNLEEKIQDFFDSIQAQTVEMIPYEQSGLQNIVKVSKNAQTACSFQTLLVVQPRNESDNESPFGTWSTRTTSDAFSNYAIALECLTEERGVRIHTTYDSEVVPSWEMDSVLDQFKCVLQKLASSALNETVGEAAILASGDEHTVWRWNRTVPEAVDKCLHELIMAQVRTRPDALAIHAWDGELSYRMLDRLSDQVAHHLVNLGVLPGSIVPLYFERCMWTTVAILSVLKVSAAFVMLEPTLPETRIASILSQTDAKLVLSSASLQAQARAHFSNVFVVGPGIPSCPRASQLCLPDAGYPAYVVFTSGSTGTPKGVVVSHRAISTNVSYQSHILGCRSDSRVFNFAASQFDIFVFETVMALANGACLCVPSDEDRKNNLERCMRDMKATVVISTPSVTRLLDPQQLPHLKTLILGGEAIGKSEFDKWWGSAKVINAYGPAETTPVSLINQTATDPVSAIPIGKGVGVVTWVADATDHSRLVPIGTIGELLLEGPLLGNGYLNDEEKTKNAFIENPAWLVGGTATQPGRQGRLYKTGDLVRYGENGDLTYMGRKDTQVKIRGQRVELEEVERHARRCVPLARTAHQLAAEVIIPSDSGANPLLAVFLSIGASNRDAPSNSNGSSSNGIQVVAVEESTREEMEARLPSYMVPSVYFSLPCLPMTATGKTDRKALRELAANFTSQQLAELSDPDVKEKRAPATDKERRLHALFSRVLDIDTHLVGMDDSFFRLGGDSITSMRLVAAAREDGLSLTVANIMRHPRLCDLVTLAEELVSVDAPTEPYSLLSLSSEEASTLHSRVLASLKVPVEQVLDVLPLTYAQKDCLVGATLSPPESCFELHLTFSTDVSTDAVCKACQRMWDDVDILRAIFVQIDNQYLQVVARLPCPDVEVDISQDPSGQCPSLELGIPYTKFALQKTGSGTRLYIRLCHAQYDGMSLNLISEYLYAHTSQQTLPPVPRFSDYIRFVHQQEGTTLHHWSSVLKGAQPQLPTLPANTTTSSDVKVLRASSVVRAPKPVTTDFNPSMLFTAASACAIADIAGLSDIVLGQLSHGRSALPARLQNTIGPCLNWVPVRLPFSHKRRVRMSEVLPTVRQQAVESAQYDTSTFENMLSACGDWPSHVEEVDVAIHFRSVFEMKDTSKDIPRIGFVAPPTLAAGTRSRSVFINVDPVGDDWNVEVLGSNALYTLEYLQQVLDKVEEYLGSA